MGFTARVQKKNTDVEDNLAAILRFADGALGEVSAAWTQLPSEDCYYFNCEKGNLSVVRGKPAVRLNSPRGTFQPEVPSESEYGNPYQHFVDCVEKGRKPIIDGVEGAKSLEVVLAAYLSERKRRPVKLPLPRR